MDELKLAIKDLSAELRAAREGGSFAAMIVRMDEHEKEDAKMFGNVQAALADFATQQATMHRENRTDIARLLIALEGVPLDSDKPGIVQRLRIAEKAVTVAQDEIRDMKKEAVARSKSAKKYAVGAAIGVAGCVAKTLYDLAVTKITGAPPHP